MADIKVKVFFSYSHKDEALRHELAQHLKPLERQGQIETWHDRKIDPGTNWRQELDSQLNAADIVLLLVSSSFVHSDFCYCTELEQARKRHDAEEARIIPIFLRPIDLDALKGTPLQTLQGLPEPTKPITRWDDRDEAFTFVAQGIRAVVNEIQQKKQTKQAAQSGVDKVVQPSQKSTRQVTLSDPDTGRKVVIVLEGDASSINNDLKAILQLALQDRGITVKITDIEPGSIRVSAEGSQDDIARLIALVQSGELTEIAGHEIKEVQIFQESLDDIEEDKSSDKWKLIERTKRFKGLRRRNLSNAILSNADLSGADLIHADLRSANLSNANLSGAYLIHANLRSANLSIANLSNANLRSANLSIANLSDAYLSRANLIHADFSDANLSGAYLSGANLSGAYLIHADLRSANLSNAILSYANLSGANLSNAILSNAILNGAILSGANLIHANLSDAILRSANVASAIFSNNRGISESLKRDLIQRGAIFEDSPGDRSNIRSPR